MGLPKQVLKTLVAENAYRPITGKFGVFGKQTVHADREFLDLLSKAAGRTLKVGNDSQTRHSNAYDWVADDKDLIESVFEVDYQILDRSPYEGADVIVDLCQPVRNELKNSYDFIYSGGTFDNVFDPAMVMRNASEMLRPGGRIVSYETAQGLLGAFLQFTPEWFYSFFASNNYKDCKVYLLHQERPGSSRFDYETTVYEWTPQFSRNPQFDYFQASLTHPGIQYILCVAEKAANSSNSEIPTQMQYIDEIATDWRLKESIFAESGRRLFDFLKEPQVVERPLPFGSDHFEPLLESF